MKVFFTPIFRSKLRKLQGYVLQISGLIGYWPMDETSGLCLNHAPSTRGNLNGNISGSGISRGVKGKVSRAYSTNGANNNVVTINDDPLLRFENYGQYTFVCMFNLSNYNNNFLPRFWEKGSTYGCIMGDSSNARYRMLGMEVTDNTSAAGEYWGNTPLNQNTSYLVAFTFDQTLTPALMGKTYLNGKPQIMTKLASNLNGTIKSTAGSNLKFFNSGGGSRSIATNFIQHMMFFNRVLSPVEISKMARIVGLSS